MNPKKSRVAIKGAKTQNRSNVHEKYDQLENSEKPANKRAAMAAIVTKTSKNLKNEMSES